MTFEMGTLLIDYRRESTQKGTGFFCKICMKLRKNSNPGIPCSTSKAELNGSARGQRLLHTDLGYPGNT
jgi:hypothetical protein